MKVRLYSVKEAGHYYKIITDFSQTEKLLLKGILPFKSISKGQSTPYATV